MIVRLVRQMTNRQQAPVKDRSQRAQTDRRSTHAVDYQYRSEDRTARAATDWRTPAATDASTKHSDASQRHTAQFPCPYAPDEQAPSLWAPSAAPRKSKYGVRGIEAH